MEASEKVGAFLVSDFFLFK